jgi:hypothetical protein
MVIFSGVMIMYKQIKSIFPNESSSYVQRLSDNAYIPMDEQNTDYQAYLKWVAEGNEPLPAENE